jgi:hypothetical protein
VPQLPPVDRVQNQGALYTRMNKQMLFNPWYAEMEHFVPSDGLCLKHIPRNERERRQKPLSLYDGPITYSDLLRSTLVAAGTGLAGSPVPEWLAAINIGKAVFLHQLAGGEGLARFGMGIGVCG